jgi:ATP-binding cassette subfamily F protein 3
LDEPTNHLDADSIAWLRNFLRAHNGGLVVISHDGDLLDSVVNKVFHLDATRTQLDVYRLGWKAYLDQLATDERRRRRERTNVERKVVALKSQADRMRAKATKARMAHNLDRRAARLTEGLEDVRRADKVARLRFPAPSPCGKTPLSATGLTKSYGSLEVFSGIDLAIDRGSRVVILGLNGAGKTTLLRVLSGIERPDAGGVVQGHGLQLGYYAQEHETLDPSHTVYENVRHNAPPTVSDAELRWWAHRAVGGHPVGRREDPTRARDARCLGGERAVVGRADEQPRSRQPQRGAEGTAHLRRRDSARHP